MAVLWARPAQSLIPAGDAEVQGHYCICTRSAAAVAIGATTRLASEIAARIKVSPPRVCQLKESLGNYVVESWGTNGIAEVSAPSQWRAGLRAVAERRAARYERRAA